MATPVFVCGAECGVVAAASHWITSTGTTSFSTTTVRTGARSLRVNPTAGTGEFDTLALASSADWVVRAYVYFATLPSATTSFISRVGTVIGVWFNASDSKVYVGSDASTLGATGVSVTTGQWYRIDFKYTATTLDAQVDGAAVGQLTGTYSAFTQLAIGRSATVTKDLFFDDIIISQTAVDYPLGAGFVKSYIPNADGTHNVAGANDFERTLTGTDITNATTDAYTLIDERPLPTTAVDFINGVAPPNATDYVEWQYEDSTESSAPRGVEAVIVHHDASGAGTNNFTVTLRESAGGTSGNIWSGTTNVGATITYKRAHFATVPGTADAWTTTKFNALRSRFLVSDASPDPYIDAAMLEAEFPEAGGPVTVTPGTAALATATFAPVIGLGIIPGTVALTLATFAPTVAVSDHQTVTPDTVALTTATFAPTVTATQNVAVTPGTVALATATFAPVVTATDNKVVTPDTLALTVASFAPAVTVGIVVEPVTAALILTGFTPTVTATNHQTVTPGTAALATATFAPVIGLGIVPSTSALTLTTFAPAVTVTEHVTVTPTTLAHSLATFAPTVTASDHQVATPGTLGLTLATFAPTVTASDNIIVTPGVTALNLATFAPTVTVSDNIVVTPGVVALALTAYAPAVTVAGGAVTVTPDTLALVLAMYAPTVTATAAAVDSALGHARAYTPWIVPGFRPRDDLWNELDDEELLMLLYGELP